MSRDVASVTIVGRAGNNPQVTVGSTGERVNFRVVATERRFDKAVDDFVDGDQFGVTVVCWKTLAAAVLTTVRKGDPVLISGRIATRRFEKNGVTQYFTEVKADFVGLDIAKAAGRFTRKPLEPGTSLPSSSPEDRPTGPDAAPDRTDQLGVQSLAARSLATQGDGGLSLELAGAEVLDDEEGGPAWDEECAEAELEVAMAPR